MSVDEENVGGWNRSKYLLINAEGTEVLRIDSEGNFYAMGVKIIHSAQIDLVFQAAKLYAASCNKEREKYLTDRAKAEASGDKEKLRLLHRFVRKVTPSQLKVLKFIQAQVQERGFPPSVREISAHFGWSSTNSCAEHLRRLEVKGMLELTPGVSRGMKVTSLAVAYLQGLSAWSGIEE